VWNDAELAGLNLRDGCHVVWIRRKTDAGVARFKSSAGTRRRGPSLDDHAKLVVFWLT